MKSRPTRLMVTFVVASLPALNAPGALAEQPAAAPDNIAPLADTSLTPPGWSPLSLGSIQLSVPSSWLVESPGFACGDRQQGMVFINEPPVLPNDSGCTLPTNVVELSSVAARLPSGYHRTVVNSVPAFERSSGSGRTRTEVVRALGVQVMAKGPLAVRVMATFTHSPLSVVLGSSVSSTPTGWRHVDFGGLSFSVPHQWALQHVGWWGGCPLNIASGALLTSSARYLANFGCPVMAPTAGNLAGRPGMVLFAGPKVAVAPGDGGLILTDRGRFGWPLPIALFVDNTHSSWHAHHLSPSTSAGMAGRLQLAPPRRLIRPELITHSGDQRPVMRTLARPERQLCVHR